MRTQGQKYPRYVILSSMGVQLLPIITPMRVNLRHAGYLFAWLGAFVYLSLSDHVLGYRGKVFSV